MLTLITRYWPYIIGVLALIALIMIVMHWKAEADKIPDLEDEITTLEAEILVNERQCQEAKQITTNIGEEYEKGRNNSDIDDKRVREQTPACIQVQSPSQASGANATNVKGQSYTGNAINSAKLYDFAQGCEQDRLKVMSLQNFINQVYQLNMEK